MALVRTNTASHWYSPDGVPCHQVPMKTKPGEFRDTNLTDARKSGLFPSVTNIIRILEKPMLNAWKEEQMVMAALTLPHIDGETLDERAQRVVRDAHQQVEDARKRGKLLHDAVENFLLFGENKPHDSVHDLFEPFPSWANENILDVHYAERVVVGDGYAGQIDAKLDLRGIGVRVVDFKTRKQYQNKFTTYDEDGFQLSAYLEGDALVNTRATGCTSVFINSETAMSPHAHHWKEEEIAHSWLCFQTIFQLWKLMKKYNPSSK